MPMTVREDSNDNGNDNGNTSDSDTIEITAKCNKQEQYQQ